MKEQQTKFLKANRKKLDKLNKGLFNSMTRHSISQTLRSPKFTEQATELL